MHGNKYVLSFATLTSGRMGADMGVTALVVVLAVVVVIVVLVDLSGSSLLPLNTGTCAAAIGSPPLFLPATLFMCMSAS